MTHDEALHEAVLGARMRPSHWQPGVYLAHSFSRGFLKCWPVDRVEDEPNRTQCDYRAYPDDEAATDWTEIEQPVLAVDHSPRDAWGRTTVAAIVAEVTQTAPAVEFCGVCDFEKSKCKCQTAPKLADQLTPKPVTVGWGNPLITEGPNKWGK